MNEGMEKGRMGEREGKEEEGGREEGREERGREGEAGERAPPVSPQVPALQSEPGTASPPMTQACTAPQAPFWGDEAYYVDALACL